MIQVTDNKVSEDMMMVKSEPENHHHLMIKTCSDCGTSRTPLWRGGPAGPKSLCNACGIRSRKQRRALIMGLSRAEEDKNSRKTPVKDYSLKRRLLSLGKQVNMLQNSMVKKKKQRRKLGEEEQAALLLMALSCGSSVFA